MFKIKIRRGGMTSNRRTYNMVCYKGEKLDAFIFQLPLVFTLKV